MPLIPAYQIRFKDESLLMKILAKIMFFNKGFMTQYTTTLGSTVYFTARSWTKLHPISAKVIMLHEMIHIKDAEKLSKPLFSLLYLLPQFLVFLSIPLFFIHWWMGLIWLVLFLTPIPAYFRMKFELKAYTFSMYAWYRYCIKLDCNIKIDQQIDNYVAQFKGPYYYFMWPFGNGVKNQLTDAYSKFQKGERPYYTAEYYQMIDQLIEDDIQI